MVYSILNESDASTKIKQRTQKVSNTYMIEVKMTSSSYSSEYLINAIPDTTDNTTMILVNVAHSQDTSTNERFTIYLFYTCKINNGNNFTFIRSFMIGTVYIYYISI